MHHGGPPARSSTSRSRVTSGTTTNASPESGIPTRRPSGRVSELWEHGVVRAAGGDELVAPRRSVHLLDLLGLVGIGAVGGGFERPGLSLVGPVVGEQRVCLLPPPDRGVVIAAAFRGESELETGSGAAVLDRARLGAFDHLGGGESVGAVGAPVRPVDDRR